MSEEEEAERAGAKGVGKERVMTGVTLNELQQITAERLEELVEIDPLTVFLIVAPCGLPGLVLEVTTLNRYVPGDGAGLVPFIVVASIGVVAAFVPRSRRVRVTSPV